MTNESFEVEDPKMAELVVQNVRELSGGRRLQYMLATTRRLRSQMPSPALFLDMMKANAGWIIFYLLVSLGVAAVWHHELLQFRHGSSGGHVCLLSATIGVSMLFRGVRPQVVFIAFLCVLAALGHITKAQIFGGFTKDGVWIAQFFGIIITAIKDSGLLNKVLDTLLFRHSGLACSPAPRWRSSIPQLYISAVLLGGILGAGPCIVVSTPVASRWAPLYGFPKKSVLWVLLLGASVGNVLFLTSAPISMAIMEISCGTGGCPFSVWQQTPLALCVGLVLGIFGFFAPYYMGENFSAPQQAPAELPLAKKDEEQGGTPEEELQAERLFYSIDFVVENLSTVIGLTPTTAGIRRADGCHIVRIWRHPATQEMYKRGVGSFTAHEEALGNTADWQQVASKDAIAAWSFQAGDVMSVRCSAAGVVAMRSLCGIYAVEGLQGHLTFGARRAKRHERQLFECVVASGSAVIGCVVNELQGWPLSREGSKDHTVARSSAFLDEHRGFPLGAWRRAEAGRHTPGGSMPIASSTEKIKAGDVLLVDAHASFPGLKPTHRDFSVVAAVAGSQVPRHGRAVDTARGVLAVVLLVAAVVLAQLQVFPLVMGLLFAVAILCVAKALLFEKVFDLLNIPLLLLIGLSVSVGVTLKETGVDYMISQLVSGLDLTGKRLFVIVFGQLMGNWSSPIAGGLITAPIALQVLARDGRPKSNIAILVIMSVNLVLCTPFAAAWTGIISAAGGFKKRNFTLYGSMASVLSVIVLLLWAEYVDV